MEKSTLNIIRSFVIDEMLNEQSTQLIQYYCSKSEDSASTLLPPVLLSVRETLTHVRVQNYFDNVASMKSDEDFFCDYRVSKDTFFKNCEKLRTCDHF